MCTVERTVPSATTTITYLAPYNAPHPIFKFPIHTAPIHPSSQIYPTSPHITPHHPTSPHITPHHSTSPHITHDPHPILPRIPLHPHPAPLLYLDLDLHPVPTPPQPTPNPPSSHPHSIASDLIRSHRISSDLNLTSWPWRLNCCSCLLRAWQPLPQARLPTEVLAAVKVAPPSTRNHPISCLIRVGG